MSKPYIWTATQFLEEGHSLGELGDIRTLPREEAVAAMERIASQRGVASGGIALLGLRVEGEAGSHLVPEAGLVYPISPSPDPQGEWNAFHDDFVHVARIPGLLHAYDRDAITLPI